LLLAAKSKAPHGAWRPFIKYHCPFSKRTASVYMRVAAHWPEIALKSAGSADLGIAQALRLLADHSDKEASPPHPESGYKAAGRQVVVRLLPFPTPPEKVVPPVSVTVTTIPQQELPKLTSRPLTPEEAVPFHRALRLTREPTWHWDLETRWCGLSCAVDELEEMLKTRAKTCDQGRLRVIVHRLEVELARLKAQFLDDGSEGSGPAPCGPLLGR
jgi:hypothetical protein